MTDNNSITTTNNNGKTMNYLPQLISELNAKPVLTEVEKNLLQSLINAYDDYLDNSN